LGHDIIERGGCSGFGGGADDEAVCRSDAVRFVGASVQFLAVAAAVPGDEARRAFEIAEFITSFSEAFLGGHGYRRRDDRFSVISAFEFWDSYCSVCLGMGMSVRF
jgi:hypothetical protein